MVKGPGLILVITVGLVAALLAYRYDQYVVQRNFIIDSVAPCDSKGVCFVSDCSPEEDSSCDQTPYEKVVLSARDAPNCLIENSCDSFSCDGIEGCSVTHCSEDALSDGEVCAETQTHENE